MLWQYRKVYPVLIDAFEEFRYIGTCTNACTCACAKVVTMFFEIHACRFIQHQLKSLCFLSPKLDNTKNCPACPKVLIICNYYTPLHVNIYQVEGTQIISMDGVFGLCRKKSARVSARPPIFSGVFFEDQQEVDNHVSSYDTASRLLDKVRSIVV